MSSFYKKAELLAEVMIAVWILSFVIISSLKIFASAKMSLQSLQLRTQAISLSREWLEIVRYIRDLNWIKYSSQRRICWNFDSDNQSGLFPDWFVDSEDKTCLPNTINPSIANYTLSWTYIALQNLDINNEWEVWRYFLSSPNSNNLGSIWENWKTSKAIYDDLKIFRLCQELDYKVITSCLSPYSTDETLETRLLNNSSKTLETNSMKFFRKIDISYVTMTGSDINSSDIDEKSNNMKVKSTVIWRNWFNYESVELTTILSDYYWRIEWEITD